MFKNREFFKKARKNITEAVFGFLAMMLFKMFMTIFVINESINCFINQKMIEGTIFVFLSVLWFGLILSEIRLIIFKIRHEVKFLELVNKFNETELEYYKKQLIQKEEEQNESL